MATINELPKTLIRKNKKKRKARESHEDKNERFRLREKPVGRTLSKESVTTLLKTAKDMGCDALFDLGAGAGLILENAKRLGYSTVGGIEAEPISETEDIFTTTFAEFDSFFTWLDKIDEGTKTLFYIYEGGIWDQQWCQDAVDVINILSKPGDMICVITHAGTVSVRDSSWDITDWENALILCTRVRHMNVYGEMVDGQRDEQIAYFFQVGSLRF